MGGTKKQIEIPDVVDLVRVAAPVAKEFAAKINRCTLPENVSALELLCAARVGCLTAAVRINNLDDIRIAVANIGAYVLGILDSPIGFGDEDKHVRRLAEQARLNIAKRGAQDLETLALVAVEECGEIADAILKQQEGMGGFQEIENEAVDLGAVCIQVLWLLEQQGKAAPPKCRVCGCTDDDCAGCIERTGQPCHWVAPDLCSACETAAAKLPKPCGRCGKPMEPGNNTFCRSCCALPKDQHGMPTPPIPCITRMVLTYGPARRRRKPAGKGA